MIALKFLDLFTTSHTLNIFTIDSHLRVTMKLSMYVPFTNILYMSKYLYSNINIIKFKIRKTNKLSINLELFINILNLCDIK